MFITTDRNSYYDKNKEFILFIKVDESCNLQCSFCYQTEKQKNTKLNTEEKLQNAYKNIDYVFNRFLEVKKEKRYEFCTLTICFFGGEPTLNLKAINQICDYIKENFDIEIRKNLRMTMTTNGIIFNEQVVETFKNMKSVNSYNSVSILISSDNSKEVYDKNRKLVGSNESGYEIVQRNIENYKKMFKEINVIDKNFVQINTVLATTEQLKTDKELIKETYKGIRRGKLLYDLASKPKDYVESAKEYLWNTWLPMIQDCSKANKDEAIGRLVENIWELHGENDFTECQSLFTIDGDGNMNWCNKHRYFENEDIGQDKMRELSVLNKNADNSHFKCVKEKFQSGDLVKNVLRPKAWKETIKRFDPTIQISAVKSDYEGDLSDFIYFMLGSSEKDDFNEYIGRFVSGNFSEKEKILLKELGIKILTNFNDLKNHSKFIYYIDKEGNVFLDESLKDNKELILTNVNDYHFIWIHTESYIKSINLLMRNRFIELQEHN